MGALADLQESINNLNKNMESLGFWINPVNWFKEGWAWIDYTVGSGTLDVPFLAGTIISIWLIMLGAEWPKKVLFWGWIIFWTLRGFICK